MACCGNKNESIKCTINNCEHHCKTENYCSLNEIQVGTHEANPTMEMCIRDRYP